MNNFKLEEVLDTLRKKKKVYLSLIQKVFKADEFMAENIFDSELENFKERLKTYYSSQKIKPTMNVLQGTNIFLEVLHLGLSFSTGSDLIYVSRLKGTGTAVGYQVTVRGEIYLATNSGAISHISEPVIVTNKDKFSLKTNDTGHLIANHEINLSDNQFTYADFKIGYCYLTYPDGSREISFTDKTKMDKSRGLSPSESMYNDTAFLQAKVIRRALKNIRKMALLNQMEVVDDVFEDDKEPIDLDFDHPSLNPPSIEEEVVPTEEEVENEPESDMFDFNF